MQPKKYQKGKKKQKKERNQNIYEKNTNNKPTKK